MSCACMPQEMADLRAQLEQERLARAQAEARLEGFREAANLFLVARQADVPARHAPSRPVTRDSVTPSVTPETPGERETRLARERKRTERERKRSVTAQRDSVTPSVTQKKRKNTSSTTPLPPPAAPAGRGALVLVTANARDSQRDRPREHRTPATLPPEVQALRTAWNELAAPHGFAPWGQRTSARLLQDALTALERRPLEEWRRAFALVPRSNVCRGELASGQRATVVKLLVGTTRDGYTWAEKLLGGEWTIDPEPGESAAPGPDGGEAAPPELESMPEGTPAALAWKRMLLALRDDRKTYALTWLGGLTLRAGDEGRLVLEAQDVHSARWVDEHYGPLLHKMAALEGYAEVRVTSPDGEGSP